VLKIVMRVEVSDIGFWYLEGMIDSVVVVIVMNIYIFGD
jgi:hypothetical protein